MKTIRIITTMGATAAVLGLGSVAPALAGSGQTFTPTEGPSPVTWNTPAMGSSTATPASEGETFEGNITGINQQDKTFSVKGLLFTRNFNAGNNCKVSLQDRPSASLAQVQPGEDVTIHYKDFDGVLVACRIDQHDMSYSGHISAIDLGARKLEIKHGLVRHSFVLPADCKVSMRGNKAAGLRSLQIGDSVAVIYNSINGSHMAKRIEENGAQFVGTIENINPDTRSVKARNLGSSGPEKMFNLADNCSIVINGKLDGSLGNLRAGERVSVSYDNDDGVLVAYRVTPVSVHTAAAESAELAPGPLHANNR